MDYLTKRKNRSLIAVLRGSLLLRLMVTIVLYTVAGPLLLILAHFITDLFIWQGDELIYRLGHAILSQIGLFFLAYIILGYIAICLYYFNKPFRYLTEILEATDSIYQDDDEMISFSSGSLVQIEGQMNHLKMTLHNNQRAAKEAEKRKNELVAYLAHDLKTPITSVIGYLSLLKDEPQISEQMRNRYLGISLDKAQRLDDLINEFFEITRFNLSSITLSYSRVNLTRMLEQLVFEFQPMLTEKELTCQLEAPSDVVIYCDPDKLSRVFDNLLRNAVGYSYPATEIHIVLSLDESHACLLFENHGPNIPEEKLSRIFEQFYRLDSSRTSGSGGTGLGLAIAKEIVELHHGEISASSEAETIRFTVKLPLK